MTTFVVQDLQQIVDRLQQAAAHAVHSASSTDFEQFERQLTTLDSRCRETQQAMWADDARVVIRHLEEGTPLTPADHDVIRAFLISDAEHYLQMENNYQDWISELDRLLHEITQRLASLDRNSVADVRGLIKDAIRLAPSIRNYLDEKNRIERCSQALESLDRKSRELLARILKDDLESTER